jgi:hypothetical protein
MHPDNVAVVLHNPITPLNPHPIPNPHPPSSIHHASTLAVRCRSGFTWELVVVLQDHCHQVAELVLPAVAHEVVDVAVALLARRAPPVLDRAVALVQVSIECVALKPVKPSLQDAISTMS